MSLQSVNGRLKSTAIASVQDEYLGHFLKISYIQKIANQPVYNSTRYDVEPDGFFRFFVPKGQDLQEQMVTVAVHAPDGELLHQKRYSFNSLKAVSYSESVEDTTESFFLMVEPKTVDVKPAVELMQYRKISGRLVDVSGMKPVAGLTVVLMGAEAPATPGGTLDFQPLITARTDSDGYFYGRIRAEAYAEVHGLIVGMPDEPVRIELDDEHRIPKELILLADLSGMPEDLSVIGVIPAHPDSDDLARSTSFSQDMGGKCVDFTVPNRTLEEFSFYHTVRTTEPEIRGLTLGGSQSRSLQRELHVLAEELFEVVGRVQTSLSSLSVIEYSIDEDLPADASSSSGGETDENVAAYSALPSMEKQPYQFATGLEAVRLKVATGALNLKVNLKELQPVTATDRFSKLVKMLARQARRKAMLQELHGKLSAAFCGRKGAEPQKSYCEQLAAKDTLNRASVRSLLGHIAGYASFVGSNPGLARQFKSFVGDVEELMELAVIDTRLMGVIKSRAEKLLQDIDHATKESQDQEELLGYMRRLLIEIEQFYENGTLDFEPCPPSEKSDTMGVVCLMQEFRELRESLRNQTSLSLGDIQRIRASYDIYINSIAAFLHLLEEFKSFYDSGSNIMISLEDSYFIDNYNLVRSRLIQLKRQIYAAITRIEQIEREYIANHPGRKLLSVENSIDWDATPTIYENTTIAHGHILHFKQKWKADGYSLGELLYSLPLAPCQEKQIAIIDWDREERAARSEAETVAESLQASLSHDRDISEIIRSSFNESIRASSSTKVSSTSAGLGGGIFGSIGGLFGGVSHSGASSRSNASQDAARNMAGSSLNRLQDNVAQSASSLRSRRSTVVQTVGQNETMTVQTEVVKNNNHCHAITIEYFEVLKHYAIEQELVDVQECLFVPMPMGPFDHEKILRWQHSLRRVVSGAKLQRGFDAIERIAHDYADSDFPEDSYADEVIEEFSGHFDLSFELARPYIAAIEEETKTIDLEVTFPWIGGSWSFPIKKEVPLTEEEKNALFESEYAPEIARKFIETIDLVAIDADGKEILLDLDYTVLSNYRRGATMQVRVSRAGIDQQITRRQIKHLCFRANTSVRSSSRIILRSAYLFYRTSHSQGYVVNRGRIFNDIINVKTIEWGFPPAVTEVTDSALIYTPLTDRELRNPRKEDREAAGALVGYLNEHLEAAHKAIWGQLDASRIFSLLDGYIAPNSGGRSVASVVENRIMGIVGNNLVLKVVPGERLDPVFRKETDLFEYYRPTTKPDPFRISVPTKGVYAESVMGKCNSCEEIDESRHWRFEEVPCGTKPTPIAEVSTASRASETGDLSTKDFPSSIIAMQTAPNAPDPTGLSGAIDLLGKSGVFKDMTGLAGNQANAIKALETTSKSVTDLAGMAADLKKQSAMKKDIGKTLKTIKEAEGNKQISKEQANALSYSALSSMVGEPTKKEATKLTEQKEVKELIKSQSEKSSPKIKISNATESVEVNSAETGSESVSFDYTVPGIVPLIAQPSGMTCWATVAAMMMGWKDKVSYTIETAMDKAGAEYRTMFDNNQGLPASKHEAFAAACGMTGEPPMCYTVSGLKSLLENHGPLIAISDEQPGDNWAIHARVLRGIYGDGTPDKTFLRINDPSGGRQYTESFTAFAQKFEEVAGAPRLQVMHF